MSTENQTKINQLLSSIPTGIVLQSTWLRKEGYSLDLQKRYRRSKWFQSIGNGAMVRKGDQVRYEGAIYALQKQSDLFIHPAGRTALSLLGKSHYIEFSSKKAILFGGKGEKLPAWFRNYDWGLTIEYHQTAFLPSDAGLTEIELKNYSIRLSDATRAIMECLYLVPKNQDLIECYEVMEGLNNLRPSHVQHLLENCQSVKVKRLFLYLSEKAGHQWFHSLNLEKIDLGKGKRSISSHGIYNSKYQITVPKELEKNGN
jgi:hypothetical protein